MNKNIKASIITILVMVIIPFILGYITALPNDCVVNIYLVGLGAELLIFSLIGVSYTIFQYIKKKNERRIHNNLENGYSKKNRTIETIERS